MDEPDSVARFGREARSVADALELAEDRRRRSRPTEPVAARLPRRDPRGRDCMSLLECHDVRAGYGAITIVPSFDLSADAGTVSLDGSAFELRSDTGRLEAAYFGDAPAA